MSAAELDADIRRLEVGIRQLKIQYDMFFNGSLQIQPTELHNELKKIVHRHQHSAMPKYATRFHFNSLVARLNSLTELWSKNVRTMEEGDRRTMTAVERLKLREQLLARCRVSDPRRDDEAMRGLYKQFREAQRKNRREKGLISYDKFVRGISRQTERLQKSSGCGEIELRLVLFEDKVQLKARPAG